MRFTISDKEGAYKANDTVWVNMTTRKVDTLDSNAMLCVIIKEF